VGPLIATLRDSVESIRQQEVDKTCKGLGEQEHLAVDKATRSVVNKILHGPLMAIRDVAKRHEEDTEQLEFIKDMFDNLHPADD